MRQSEVVVVIGTRPNLDDDHVGEPILESAADVWHIGGTSGDDFEEYEGRLGRRLSKLGDAFDEAIGNLDVRLRIVA